MKKEDLKTGMLIETRDGLQYIVLENAYGWELLAIGKEEYISLNTHNDDLTYCEQELDVVKVYGLPISRLSMLKISTDDRNLIWKREDLKAGDIVRVKRSSDYHHFEKGQLVMVGKSEYEGWVRCYGRINGTIDFQSLKIGDIEKVDI